jgi:iron complex transport system substrate-binding protein
LSDPWVQISLEELITRNPDVIFVGDYTWGGVTAADVIARPGWEAINAVQNGQVFEFDDNLVSRPGPRMVDGLEQMAKLLHPELFK